MLASDTILIAALLGFAAAEVAYFSCRLARCRQRTWSTTIAGSMAIALSLTPFPNTLLTVAALVAVGILLSAYDLRLLIVPDVLIASLLAAGVAYGLSKRTFNPTDTLLGGLAGACILGAPLLYYRHVRNLQALGTGDVKLMAVIGAIVGPSSVPVTVAFASIITLSFAALRSRFKGAFARHQRLPFAPGLLAGLAIHVIARW